MSDTTFISAVSMEWFLQKGDCSNVIRLAFSRYPRIWSATLLSMTFEIKVEFEMGR